MVIIGGERVKMKWKSTREKEITCEWCGDTIKGKEAVCDLNCYHFACDKCIEREGL